MAKLVCVALLSASGAYERPSPCELKAVYIKWCKTMDALSPPRDATCWREVNRLMAKHNCK